MGGLTRGFKPCARSKKNFLSSSSLQAPIEARLRTGQAAELSNGVKNSVVFFFHFDNVQVVCHKFYTSEPHVGEIERVRS